MTLTVLNILYALVALGMIGLILLQRGAGAQAGSGFGSGASATVFGSRGSSNFLTRTTAILGALFFLLSLGMGMYIARLSVVKTGDDLGVMTGATVPAATLPTETTVPVPVDVPTAPAPDASVAPTDVPPAPAATAPATDVPAASPAAELEVKEKTTPATEEPSKR